MSTTTVTAPAATDPGRVCTRTGLHLVAAAGETAYRIAHDRYVQRAGIDSAPENRDAAAVGLTIDEYIAAVLEEAEHNDVDRPWAISGDWQFTRSIHTVSMPRTGWWVVIDQPATQSTLTRALALDLTGRPRY